MTVTDTRPETTLIGLHAAYPDRSYGVSTLGGYFRAFDNAWRMCNALALYRFIVTETLDWDRHSVRLRSIRHHEQPSKSLGCESNHRWTSLLSHREE